jgi:hypothetical protein
MSADDRPITVELESDMDDSDHFTLVVNDYVPFIDPVNYGIDQEEMAGINPADYFVTSGDAVSKATMLEKEMWTLAGIAQKRFGRSKVKVRRQFAAALWKAAGKCRALVNKLKKVRGSALWLETAWEDHKLICVPKNPRKKDEGSQPCKHQGRP